MQVIAPPPRFPALPATDEDLSPRTRDRDYDPDPVNDRAVFRWMVATSIAVVVALVIGGITRLTESGLSITEWKPVSGVLPPLSATEWADAYQRYLQIPEAQTVHRGISLSSFKSLFWWEWVHRMLARLVGLVIAAPFFVLLLRRQVQPGLQLRLANLPILVAMQGVLGWYMVKSGLTGRTDVSQYRLVAHLALALVIFVIATWTAMTMATGAGGPAATRAPARTWNRAALGLAVLTFTTILSGGFVAGLDAGHIFNTFPLMGGRLIPQGYAQLDPLWRNWFENPAAVQLNHRALATLTLVTALVLTWSRLRSDAPRETRKAWMYVAWVVALQFVLGITTLLLAVPISIAALHQLGAVALLTASMWAMVAGAPARQPSLTASSGGLPRTSDTTFDTTPAS